MKKINYVKFFKSAIKAIRDGPQIISFKTNFLN